MSFAKGKLKIARDSLSKKDYAGAKDAATQVLEYEPENYNAHVFLGLALLELGEHDKSEQIYRKAIDLNPTQVLAWQGASKFYERTEDWEKYAEVLQHMMEIYSNSNDMVKCAETLQKLVELRRTRGTRSQLIDVLSYLLPGSSIYPVLSALPLPDPTNPTATTTFYTQTSIHNSLPVLEEIIALVELQENELMKKEVDKRRMRLGAPSLENLTKEVQREILGTSRLPTLYNEILNHAMTGDELRRITDSKLLRHKRQYLHSLPHSEELSVLKSKVAAEVEELINGAIILQIPDELAWTIFLESKDCEEIASYDQSYFRQFIKLFPTLPLTSLLKGYFTYMGIPTEDESGEEHTETPEEDVFDTILNAHTAIPNSIIANRVLAQIYLNETDYENAIKVAEAGLEVLNKAEASDGKKLAKVRVGFMVILATSLVHLFPPKHHVRALPIIDEVLLQSPQNIACLMSRGYILQAAEQWKEALTLFAKVDGLLPDDEHDGLRAKEELSWCQCHIGEIESGVAVLQSVLDTLQKIGDRDVDCARCLWRLGKCHWDMGNDKRDEAYRYFIASLKRNPAHAPAFTSLGIYYTEFASPPDPIRGSKCFQKAFELDPREADAARRLAEGFAEERDWDLVEIVARRTIEGEGGLNAGLGGKETGGTTRYLPKNAWAWKSVGVVELNRRNFAPAIQAFQIALRAEPEDQLSWLRLGESYNKAGRHAAALKALGQAHNLDPSDWICAYFIGEVHQRMGQFQEAIRAFEMILTDRPSEIGVLVALAQTYLDLGRAELSDGFHVRAEYSFVASIRVALRAIEESPGFRGVVWKVIADAIFFLSQRSSFINEDIVGAALMAVVSLIPTECSSRLTGVAPLHGDVTINAIKTLEIAAFAYDYRKSLGSSEMAARASASFDLGTTLHLISTRAVSNPNQQQIADNALSCLTDALKEDAGNDTYWIALGNAYFLTQVKLAQHGYIKALEIDSKNVIPWTNLGLLYLHNEDLELANEALYRAQTLDPDHTVAWIGQALVATANGHHLEAHAMFQHAIGLTANIPEADLEYSQRAFEQHKVSSQGRSPPPADALLPAFFVLDRYCKSKADDASALHLFGLICESLGQLEYGEDLIRRAIVVLEAAYEETEDPRVERQFTIAHSNMARLRLSLGDYIGASESFESALGLLVEDDVATPTLRAQVQVGLGLVGFRQGDLEAAINHFEGALDNAGDNLALRGQITVLLAQTMWAVGTEEFRESAKSLLLECITTDPENLTAINTLAGMGILTDDDSLVDAALSEILSLPLERRYDLDPGRGVNYLLIKHHLGQGEPNKAMSIAQTALFAEPSQLQVRKELAALTLQQGQYGSALAVLAGGTATDDSDALNTIPAFLSLEAVAHCLNGANPDDAKRKAQRAVMLSPSDMGNWRALAYVRQHV